MKKRSTLFLYVMLAIPIALMMIPTVIVLAVAVALFIEKDFL